MIENLETRVLMSAETFGGEDVASLRDGDGTTIQIYIKGAGTGAAEWDKNKIDLQLSDMSESSSLIIKTSGGDGYATLGDITIDGSLEYLLATRADVRGNVTISGSLGRAYVADVASDKEKLWTIANGDNVVLSMGRVRNLSINAKRVSFAAITAFDWLDEPASDSDSLTARRITKLTIAGHPRFGAAGDFQADLTVRDLDSMYVASNGRFELHADHARSIYIRGNLSRSDVHFIPMDDARPAGLERLIVGRTMKNSAVTALADIGSVEVDAMIGSRITAGVRYVEIKPGKFDQPLPDERFENKKFDFTGKYTIDSVQVLGRRGLEYAFDDSKITAFKLGDITLADVKGFNDDNPFGVSGFYVESVRRWYGGEYEFMNERTSIFNNLVIRQLFEPMVFDPSTGTFHGSGSIIGNGSGFEWSPVGSPPLKREPDPESEFGLHVANIKGHSATKLYQQPYTGLFDARNAKGKRVLSDMTLADIVVAIAGVPQTPLKVVDYNGVNVLSTSVGPEIRFTAEGLFRGWKPPTFSINSSTTAMNGRLSLNVTSIVETTSETPKYPLELIDSYELRDALDNADVEYVFIGQKLRKMTEDSWIIGRVYDDRGASEIHLTQKGKFKIIDNAGEVIFRADTLREALLGEPGQLGENRMAMAYYETDKNLAIHGLRRGGTATFCVPEEVILNIAGDLFYQPSITQVKADLKSSETELRFFGKM